MRKIKIENLDEMKTFSKVFLKSLTDLKKEKSLLVCLSGDLGSGKTTFTQNIGKLLKIKEKISSPTFVISKKYKIPKNDFTDKKFLIHIDAYRLGEKNSLKNIGLDEQLKNSENLIFLEWPEIIEKFLPREKMKINFEYISENERNVFIK